MFHSKTFPIIELSWFLRERTLFLRLLLLRFLALSLPLIGVSTCASQDDVTEIVARIWTDKQNRQVSATFKAKLGDLVKVEKYNGEMASFPYESLVEGDQRYVDAVVRQFGLAPGARTWSDTNGQNFRGSFVTLDKSEIVFVLLDEERRMNIETLFVTSQDVEFILDELNKSVPRNRTSIRYRVWSYRDANNNELKSIGQYKTLSGEKVVLNQVDGVHMIPLSRLKDSDLDYIVGLDPNTRGIVSQFQTQQTSDGASSSKKSGSSSKSPEIGAIWWVSLGLIFLLMLVLISVKYVYESGAPEFDDDF